MGGFYYYGIDSLYIYLVVPAIIIMLWSQIRVKTVFSKYSTHHSPLTGADAARRVLEANGVYNVKIERVSGNLTDHYDPRTNVIRLSDSVYGANNLSAVGVAAHEAGHAVQYSKGYVPIKVRSVILPVCNFNAAAYNRAYLRFLFSCEAGRYFLLRGSAFSAFNAAY